MDKHLRRSVQSRVLETEHISIIDKLNPLTNLKKHKGVTGAGVLFLALDTGRCLFQLRNSDKRHKNTWGFWGGMIEGNEIVVPSLLRLCATLSTANNASSTGGNEGAALLLLSL